MEVLRKLMSSVTNFTVNLKVNPLTKMLKMLNSLIDQ